MLLLPYVLDKFAYFCKFCPGFGGEILYELFEVISEDELGYLPQYLRKLFGQTKVYLPQVAGNRFLDGQDNIVHHSFFEDGVRRVIDISQE